MDGIVDWGIQSIVFRLGSLVILHRAVHRFLLLQHQLRFRQVCLLVSHLLCQAVNPPYIQLFSQLLNLLAFHLTRHQVNHHVNHLPTLPVYLPFLPRRYHRVFQPIRQVQSRPVSLLVNPRRYRRANRQLHRLISLVDTLRSSRYHFLHVLRLVNQVVHQVESPHEFLLVCPQECQLRCLHYIHLVSQVVVHPHNPHLNRLTFHPLYPPQTRLEGLLGNRLFSLLANRHHFQHVNLHVIHQCNPLRTRPLDPMRFHRRSPAATHLTCPLAIQVSVLRLCPVVSQVLALVGFLPPFPVLSLLNNLRRLHLISQVRNQAANRLGNQLTGLLLRHLPIPLFHTP